MTSLGIEWDTQGLIYLGGDNIYTNDTEYKLQQQLPNEYIEKTPAVKGDKWSISLEMINLNKNRTKSNIQPVLSDCLYSLEAQLGVFRSSNEKMFNIDEFFETCKKFQEYWSQMIDNKYIIINNKKYPVLAHKSLTDIQDGSEYYIDCARQKKGVIKSSGDIKWVYTDLLLNVVGKPQITCGIKLKYIISLFSYITKLHNECINNDPNKPCLSVGQQKIFKYIKHAYYDTALQIVALNFQQFDVHSQNVISMIILTNYMFIVLIDVIKHGVHFRQDLYTKSFFSIKLRSNLRYMYDTILTKRTRKFYNKWVHSMLNIKGFAGFIDNINLMSDWWESFIKTPLYGWVITGIKTKGLIMDISPLGIFNISKNQYKILNNHLIFKKVFVDKGTSQELPHIIYKNNHIQYRNADEIKKFDYMEWISVNDTIFFELRGLESLFNLTKNTKTSKYIKQPKTNVTSKSLCLYVGVIIKNLLNPMLAEPIIYPTAPSTYRPAIKIPKPLTDDDLLAELTL